MARKKAEKVIHLVTESFDNNVLDVLQMLEPGPVYIVTGDTPDGLGVYLCDQPFTLEEAEEQHSLEEEDPEDDFSEVTEDEQEAL